MSRKKIFWVAGGSVAGAGALGALLVLLLAPAPGRIGGPGEAYLGMAWKSVRWPLPDDPGLHRFLVFEPGRPLQGGGAFIGPYEVEVQDLHGVLYRDAGDRLKLGVDWWDRTPQLILVFGHTPGRPLRGSDGELYDAASGARLSSGLTAKDGRVFTGQRDTPARVRVTIGRRYYFEWRRQERRKN